MRAFKWSKSVIIWKMKIIMEKEKSSNLRKKIPMKIIRVTLLTAKHICKKVTPTQVQVNLVAIHHVMIN